MIFLHRIIFSPYFWNTVQLFNNSLKVLPRFSFPISLQFDCLDEDMCNTTKLCYLILLCIAEDEFANATMHDENVVFSVYLHRAV